ncbi:hypothetical protein N7532_001663 [Penicillium argentinense]|uniref:Uncharacterized protein n=1 Tax=Penicillium argentinense TaxID=1131581 RepID=A0A9W9G313_9EURO|nr:uncharacterized protein N7532_001663 [Penicillium argentinense]KAJ5111128.1 hypothetical protein N7532_001663 [Penicillium argentinense]
MSLAVQDTVGGAVMEGHALEVLTASREAELPARSQRAPQSSVITISHLFVLLSRIALSVHR